MFPTWTSEQILAMAPDPSSAKKGKELAVVGHWVTLGSNQAALWGECKGSGSKPYQTQIDLNELAFKCSCPSRKFPCKHSLGLFLLYNNQASAFTQTSPPDWVSEWMNLRLQKQTKKTESKSETPLDPATAAKRSAKQAKTAAQRDEKVAAGVEELTYWVQDLIRQGLATAKEQPYSFWDGTAARMVDAQAPGLARLVRELGSIPTSLDNWAEKLLTKLGRLHLLITGYQQLEKLPLTTVADIRSLIGWTINQEEVLIEKGIRDRWLVLGQRIEQEDKLKVQRIWLWGEESGKSALILNFTYGNQALDLSLTVGTCIDAELVFFPSAYSLRALVKVRHGMVEFKNMLGYSNIVAMNTAYTNAIALYPWLEIFPVPLTAVIPIFDKNSWAIADQSQYILPISRNFEQGWHLLALSGGHPMGLFGEWNGEFFLPLSAWVNGTLYQF